MVGTGTYHITIMPEIVQTTLGKAMRIGTSYYSSSRNAVISREMAWGSNWKIARIGLLCNLVAVPSESFDRAAGLMLGFSSGSRTFQDNVPDKTFSGLWISNWSYILGYSKHRFLYNDDPTSGSFFTVDQLGALSYINGAQYHKQSFSIGNWPLIANGSDANKRRSILIFEMSCSSVSSTVDKFSGMYSSSAANRDFTPDELKAALTSSYYPLTPSVGLALTTQNNPVIGGFDTASYPLDHAFIAYIGSPSLEIHDWYIYKVA